MDEIKKQVHLYEFRLKLSQGQLRNFLALGFLCFFAGDLSPESVTLSTYYPAPAGVYNNMLTTGNTWLARDNIPGTGIPSSVELGGNVPVSPGTKLAVLSGNVGIGTNAPQSALSVNGGVQLGTDPSPCTAAKNGTLSWNLSKLQVCEQASGVWTWTPVGGGGQSWTHQQYLGSGVMPYGVTLFKSITCPAPSPGGCIVYVEKSQITGGANADYYWFNEYLGGQTQWNTYGLHGSNSFANVTSSVWMIPSGVSTYFGYQENQNGDTFSAQFNLLW